MSETTTDSNQKVLSCLQFAIDTVGGHVLTPQNFELCTSTYEFLKAFKADFLEKASKAAEAPSDPEKPSV